MPLFARKINAPTAPLWADAEGDWESSDFPFEILSDLKDGRGDQGGLSVFECTSADDPMLVRVAAAMYFGTDQKKEPEKTIFRFVSSDELTAAGIEFVKSPGDTKDAEVNNLHYDVKGLNGPKALVLARLFAQSAPQTVKQPAIIVSLTEGLRTGRHSRIEAKEKCLVAINLRNGVEFSETALVFKGQ